MDDCEWTYKLHQYALDSQRKQAPVPEKLHTNQWECEEIHGRRMGKLERLYWGIDAPLSQVLMEMETSGVLIDWRWLREVEERLTAEKQEISARLEKFLGWPLNPNSVGQVADALFSPPPDGLGLPTAGIPIGAAGHQSTADKVIKKFNKFHPVVEDVIKYRSLDTVLGGFVTKLIKLATESPDGRVYSGFNQTRTVIGRLSCIAKGTPVEIVRDVGENPVSIPIEEVRPGDLAYTYDDDLILALRPVKQAWKTGHRKVIRLHWQGQDPSRYGHLDLTSEHPVRLVGGAYKRADRLQPSDRIMALSREVNTYGYTRHHRVVRVEVLNQAVEEPRSEGLLCLPRGYR